MLAFHSRNEYRNADKMRVLLSVAVACALLAVIRGHSRQEKIPPNRCLPGQSCFPSRQALREFASTLTGRLLQPFDNDYRGYISMTNERLTQHPWILVVAANVDDVQKAMKFARKYKLLVSTQTTVSDESGRSSFDGSLQINLSELTGVTSLVNSTARSEYGEVTAYAGTTWDAVYSQARTLGRDIAFTSTMSLPIGMSVGDGGVGPLVKVYGLVSDNVLSMTLVTADGNLVTVDETDVQTTFANNLNRRVFDRSLFAALAGGGSANTYGVVVSYTFKMHPAPSSIVHVTARYRLWEDGDYVGKNVLNFLVGAIPLLPDTWGGSFAISGTYSTTEAATKGELIVELFYYGPYGFDSDYFFIDNLLGFDAADSLISVVTVNRSSVYDFELQQQPLAGNLRFYSFNTFIQYDKVNEMTDGTEKLTNGLLFALNNPTVESSFACYGEFLGGASQVEARNVSYVNPALRTSNLLLSCGLFYPLGGLDDSYYVDHTLDFANMLEPFGEGKYWRAIDQDLPDWKHELYGDKYSHLLDVKVRYDIDNFLWCHNCVGSDFRVSCRKNGRQHDKGLIDYLRTRVNERKYEGATHEVKHPYVSNMIIKD